MYQNLTSLASQCDQMTRQMVNQTNHSTQVYQQMAQIEEQNARELERLVQRERQTAQQIQQLIRTHENTIQQLNQMQSLCSQIVNESRNLMARQPYVTSQYGGGQFAQTGPYSPFASTAQSGQSYIGPIAQQLSGVNPSNPNNPSPQSTFGQQAYGQQTYGQSGQLGPHGQSQPGQSYIGSIAQQLSGVSAASVEGSGTQSSTSFVSPTISSASNATFRSLQ